MTSYAIALLLILPSGASASEKSQPLSPGEALSHLQLPDDLVIEVVAAEPLIADPVAITFDERGRLFVVEYRDYPNGPGEGQPPLSRIRLLRDTDGDGQMDEAVTFADQLSFAQGILAYDGGLLVTSAPEVVHLRDTDGDDRADERTVLFKGFQPGNPQLRTAHPRRGLDNWIYLTNGLSNGNVTSAADGASTISLQGHDFRFHPKSMAFEPATGFGQFGNTFDDVGRRFFCSNRNPTMLALIPNRALTRNPWISVGNGYEDIAPFGGDAKVYPIAKTNTTAFEHTGTHTAACGVTVHRGTALGGDYKGCVFVCEPTGHLVTRSYLKPDGVSLRSERAEPRRDFLTSDDTWFRPVSLADGPDGSLYVVDMYRQVIEHPQYMPPGLAETLDLRAGDDRGRIYRIKSKGKSSLPLAPSTEPREWVRWLESDNGWTRDLGQRLLVERGQGDVTEELEQILNESQRPLARLHAFWTLEGLSALTARHVERALQDDEPDVRMAGLTIAPAFFATESKVRQAVLAQTMDKDVRVGFAFALGCGDLEDDAVDAGLASLVVQHSDPWLRRAVLTASANRSPRLVAHLLRDKSFDPGSTENLAFLRDLAEIAGKKGEAQELALLATEIEAAKSVSAACQSALVAGVLRGIATGSSELSKRGVVGLRKDPQNLELLRDLIDQSLQAAAEQATSTSLPPSQRVAALALVAYLPYTEAASVTRDVLDNRPSSAIQSASIQSLVQTRDPQGYDLLLYYWRSLSPEPQRQLIDACLTRTDALGKLLQKMKAGEIPTAAFAIEQRARVLASRDQAIASLAKELLGGDISANRKNVLEEYQSALARQGQPHAGQAVFRKVCATCHRVRGEGHEVGPDLTDVRNKTAETLMADILDPNRAVEPRFAEYIASTVDGRVLTGLLIRESEAEVVLRRAEGKDDVIDRAELEDLRATGRSVMPEGIEKEVTPQQMADLLAFLKDETP